jgi:flavin-dependent dehydrogenase
VGAGPAGAAAALFAARRGHSVTVVERDRGPRGGYPESQGAAWPRVTVPQARQGHTFLALAMRVLRAEAPDVLAAARGWGAIEVPLAHHPGEANLISRRLVVEAALRRALVAQPGVALRPGLAATGLERGRATKGVTRVVGVLTRDGRIPGDVVVDATGRRAASGAWLRVHGIVLRGVVAHTSRFTYITRPFRLRPGRRFPDMRVPLIAGLDYATVLAFPEDAGHFQLTVMLSVDDPCRRALRDGRTFDRFLARVPLAAPWLAAGDALDEPQLVGGVHNRWRRLVDGRRALVAGLVLLGDAAIQTNPTAARGIALALAHAQRLARDLDDGAADPLLLTSRFEAWTTATLGPWLRSQVAIDEERDAQLRAVLAGRRRPPGASARLAGALAAQRDDALIGAAAERLYNLLMTPAELVADRPLMRRLHRRAAPRAEPARAAGPDRAGFERIIGACALRVRPAPRLGGG